jgi:hypothetical protein
MKLRIVTAGAFAVVLGATVALAQVKIILDDPKPAAPAPGKADPSKPAPKADGKKKDDGKAKKADEMGKITGIEIPRGSGFMGIELVNGTFKLSFYDAKKKPVAPDVDRAALKWTVKTQSLPERLVLNRDGNALTSPKVIKPPYNFGLAITLFHGEGEAAATESFAVAFGQ